MGKINDLIANNKLEDAAAYLYNAFYTILNNNAPNMYLTKDEFAKVAPELVKKLQNPTSSTPTEKTPEPGDDVVVNPEKGVLSVTFVGPEGDDDFIAPPAVEKNIIIGSKFNFVPPTVVGYEADPKVVTGTMVQDGVQAIVTYAVKEEEEETGILLITYEGPVGGDFVAPTAVEQEIVVGESYSVTSPAVTGYTPDKAVVNGTMTADGVEVTVTYSKDNA